MNPSTSILKSPLVANLLNGDLPTVNVSVTIPSKTIKELVIAALIVGGILIFVQSQIRMRIG